MNKKAKYLNYVPIEFVKVEGAGNDFVLIDNRECKYRLPFHNVAKILCDRHRGIGADGILLIEKSKRADIKVRYLNSDGSEGAMCGNGGRCVANYALNKQNRKKISIEMLGHIYKAEYFGENIRLYMMNPSKPVINIKFPIEKKVVVGSFIDTGAPHLVVFIQDLPHGFGKKLESIDVKTLGRHLRNEKLFLPNGTNVNFIEARKNRNIYIRTYEKGVEDETLACGTGSIAAAIISALKYKWNPPIKVCPQSKSELIINFQKAGDRITDVFIEGKAKIVFYGKLNFSKRDKSIV
jgi:diaminopimelate epimerase